MRGSGTTSTTARTTTDTSNTHDSGASSPVLHLRNGSEKKSNKNKNKVRRRSQKVPKKNQRGLWLVRAVIGWVLVAVAGQKS